MVTKKKVAKKVAKKKVAKKAVKKVAKKAVRKVTKKTAKKVTKKAAASTRTKRPASRPRTRAKRAAPAGFSARLVKPKLSPEERFNKIQEISYFLAERDGFRGAPDYYWFSAEALVAERYD